MINFKNGTIVKETVNKENKVVNRWWKILYDENCRHTNLAIYKMILCTPFSKKELNKERIIYKSVLHRKIYKSETDRTVFKFELVKLT